MSQNVGIIADGGTDFPIFKEMVKCLLVPVCSPNDEPIKFVELRRQSIRDFIDQYWRSVDRIQRYCLPHEPALKLRNEVTNVLLTAYNEWVNEVGSISNHDILLLTTDAERSLSREDFYLQDWGFNISKVLMAAIEKFYSVMIQQGYSLSYLPYIISLITFPSTEILVAAARGEFNRCIGRNPRELKQLLYGTSEIRTVSDDDLRTGALEHLTESGVQRIFQTVPESRLFIQTLSLNSFCPIALSSE